MAAVSVNSKCYRRTYFQYIKIPNNEHKSYVINRENPTICETVCTVLNEMKQHHNLSSNNSYICI